MAKKKSGFPLFFIFCLFMSICMFGGCIAMPDDDAFPVFLIAGGVFLLFALLSYKPKNADREHPLRTEYRRYFRWILSFSFLTGLLVLWAYSTRWSLIPTALAVFFALATLGFMSEAKTTRKNLQLLRRQGYTDDIALAFHKDCVSGGIDKIQSAELRQSKLDIHFQSKPEYAALAGKITPVLLYEAGQKVAGIRKAAADESSRKASENAQRSAVRKAKEPVLAEHRHAMRFSECTGRDKHIAIVNEAIKKETELAEAQVNVAKALKLGSRPKSEKNAYIAGGIAEGLGGTAAGIMTAADTMRSNAAIRQQNAQTADARRQMTKLANTMEYTNLGNIPSDVNYKYSAALAAAQSALVDPNVTPDQLMRHLLISTAESKTDTSTGYVTIPVTVTVSDLPLIGGELPAVIDGTLTAKFLRNGQVVHTQKLPLPQGGIRSNHKLTLRCIDSRPDEKFVMPEYDVIEWRPYRLWLIEPLPTLPAHTASPYENMDIAKAIGSIQL